MKATVAVAESGERGVPSLWVGEKTMLREKTFKVLREAILSGHLKPGVRLVERDLCQMTGVSRSSIREALRYLESEGLVESRGIKGVCVSVLTIEDAAEIYEVQRGLESEAASHFCERASDAEMETIVEAYNAVRRAARRDPQGDREAIDKFFEHLFAGAKNSTAASLMLSLRARIRSLRQTYASAAERKQSSVEQMGKIVNALIRRDGELAAIECRHFVAGSPQFPSDAHTRDAGLGI